MRSAVSREATAPGTQTVPPGVAGSVRGLLGGATSPAASLHLTQVRLLLSVRHPMRIPATDNSKVGRVGDVQGSEKNRPYLHGRDSPGLAGARRLSPVRNHGRNLTMRCKMVSAAARPAVGRERPSTRDANRLLRQAGNPLEKTCQRTVRCRPAKCAIGIRKIRQRSMVGAAICRGNCRPVWPGRRVFDALECASRGFAKAPAPVKECRRRAPRRKPAGTGLHRRASG
jgi:hypothetical protein